MGVELGLFKTMAFNGSSSSWESKDKIRLSPIMVIFYII
jgi:hypothetical protein